MRTQSKTGDLLEARENASEQMGIGFSFVFDWLRWWRQVSGPITERSEVKKNQSNPYSTLPCITDGVAPSFFSPPLPPPPPSPRTWLRRGCDVF